MKNLALIIAILGMMIMTAPAFAGGIGSPLSDVELDSVYAAGTDDDDDDPDIDPNYGVLNYFDGVNMSNASGVVLIGTMVNSTSVIQVNLGVFKNNSGAITASGTNTVTGIIP